MKKKDLFDLISNKGFFIKDLSQSTLILLFGSRPMYGNVEPDEEDDDPDNYDNDLEKGQAYMRTAYSAYEELCEKEGLYREIQNLIDGYNCWCDPDNEIELIGDHYKSNWLQLFNLGKTYFNCIPDDEEFSTEIYYKYYYKSE